MQSSCHPPFLPARTGEDTTRRNIKPSFLAFRRAQFGTSTGTFWHFDGHHRFGMWTGAVWHVDGHILACRRTPSFWHVDGRSLACPRVDLLFFTLLFSLSQLLFGMSTDTIVLACGRVQFGMSTGTFWHVDGHHRFGMSTGAVWHVHESIYYFSLYYFPCTSSFLASRGVALAGRIPNRWAMKTIREAQYAQDSTPPRNPGSMQNSQIFLGMGVFKIRMELKAEELYFTHFLGSKTYQWASESPVHQVVEPS